MLIRYCIFVKSLKHRLVGPEFVRVLPLAFQADWALLWFFFCWIWVWFFLSFFPLICAPTKFCRTDSHWNTLLRPGKGLRGFEGQPDLVLELWVLDTIPGVPLRPHHTHTHPQWIRACSLLWVR